MISSALKVRPIIEDIYDIVSQITPFDIMEDHHIQDTLEWINSGETLFRIKKPDFPSTHLVCYFVILDEKASKILLVDHKKSGLWLPSGGHVDVDENPKETVRRECLEELQLEADFWCEQPVFLTSTVTVGLTPGHTDISLWYVLSGNHQDSYLFDEGEFNEIRWFDFDQIPYEKSDPHMGRFIHKLETLKSNV